MLLALLVACAPEPSSPGSALRATPEAQERASGEILVEETVTGLAGLTDAAPDSKAKAVYFLADGEGGPWLWSARFKEKAGSPVAIAAFAGARNLALSSDDRTVYVAAAAGVWSVPAGGGSAALVAGTAGYAPEGLDVVAGEDGDELVFTGFDPGDGAPGAWRIPAAGGEPAALAVGAPLALPSGVVVGADGVAWIADQAAGADGRGALVRAEDGAGAVVADGFEAGDPAGIALAPGEGSVLVSALDDTGHSIVFIVDASDYATSTFNDGIAASLGSGGLHQAGARKADSGGDTSRSSASDAVYGWVSVTSGTGGQGVIYRISF